MRQPYTVQNHPLSEYPQTNDPTCTHSASGRKSPSPTWRSCSTFDRNRQEVSCKPLCIVRPDCTPVLRPKDTVVVPVRLLLRASTSLVDADDGQGEDEWVVTDLRESPRSQPHFELGDLSLFVCFIVKTQFRAYRLTFLRYPVYHRLFEKVPVFMCPSNSDRMVCFPPFR